jgi:hypothetical protein
MAVPTGAALKTRLGRATVRRMLGGVRHVVALQVSEPHMSAE